MKPQGLRGSEPDRARDLFDARSGSLEVALCRPHSLVRQPAMRGAPQLGPETAQERARRQRRRAREIVDAERTVETPQRPLDGAREAIPGAYRHRALDELRLTTFAVR